MQIYVYIYGANLFLFYMKFNGLYEMHGPYGGVHYANIHVHTHTLQSLYTYVHKERKKITACPTSILCIMLLSQILTSENQEPLNSYTSTNYLPLEADQQNSQCFTNTLQNHLILHPTFYVWDVLRQGVQAILI